MKDFSPLIHHWYRQNKRNLPWRETKNAYFIWLSEIIMQQTRIDQGLKYYLKFIEHYPTVFDLANASEEDILNDWQGLGYYSRARNLHFSAKHIANELNGEFPSTYENLIKLKGVGKYTAAAIASIAFDQPKAVVDGNVYRFLSRLLDIDIPIDSSEGEKLFQQIADDMIPAEYPGDHNQAMMEFGATVCTPKPNCDNCIFQLNCLAKINNTIAERPLKSKKTKIRDRYFHYLICANDRFVIIEKRTQKDIWQHLYQFPLIENNSEELDEPGDWFANKRKESEEIVHVLSHQKIHAKFHHIDFIPQELAENRLIVKIEKLQDYPVPRIIDRYLETNSIL